MSEQTRIEKLRKAESEYTGPAQNKAIAQFVNDVYRELQTHKFLRVGQNHSRWNEWLNIYDGVQVPDKMGRVAPKSNMTFQLIEEEKPTFINVSVSLDVKPRQPDDVPLAAFYQDMTAFAQDEVDIRKLDRKATDWQLKLGTYFGKVWFDENAKNGMGQLKTAILDPRTVYFDEHALDVESASIIITATVMPTDTLVQRYPDKKWEISSSTTAVIEEDVFRAKERNTGKRSTAERESLVIEMWIRDPKTTGDGSESNLEEPVPVYPEGRVITVVGDVLLADRANPFTASEGGHGEFPFFMGQCYDNPESYLGVGEIEVLEPDQRELDICESMISSWVRQACIPWLVLPQDTKVDPKTISNRLGLILRPVDSASSSGIRFLIPAPLPNHVYQRAQEIPVRMRKRIGVDEVGVDLIRDRTQPVGTMQIVQETSQARMLGKIDNKNRGWARWAKLAIGCYRQFAQEQIVRVSSGINLEVRREWLDQLETERFDIQIVPSGRILNSPAMSFAAVAELDRMQVFGPPESPARRRFLAQASGVKGAMSVVDADEERMNQMAEEQAAMAQQPPMAPPPVEQPIEQDLMEQGGVPNAQIQ